MNTLNNQELQVVRAFSSVDLPEAIFKSSNIKDLIIAMAASQRTVGNQAEKLEQLRKEKKDANFISNYWHDRNDGIQEAQLDLNTSIGNLTQKSSQLLIVNTAISKVLSNQQQILLQQQNLLEQQTNELKNQNLKILDQQKELEQQQKEINAANQGLLEAKGLTQEQAQQLVGCVVRVTDAEMRIDLANQELLNTVEQRYANLEHSLTDQLSVYVEETKTKLDHFSSNCSELSASLEQKLHAHTQAVLEKTIVQDEVVQQLQGNLTQRLKTQQQAYLAIVDQKGQETRELLDVIEFNQKNFQEEHAKAIEVQRDSLKLTLQQVAVELGSQGSAMKNTGAQLLVLQEVQQQSTNSNRVFLVAVACVAFLSLAWQIAQHFALV